MNWTVEEIRAVWEAGRRFGRLVEHAQFARLMVGGYALRQASLEAADAEWGKVTAMLEEKFGVSASPAEKESE